MKHSLQARFAYQIGAVGEAGLPDAQLYSEALADAELIHRLGYDAAWVIEHHFSDYYPQPNPNRGWRAINVRLVGESAKKYHVRTRNGYRPTPNRFTSEPEPAPSTVSQTMPN